MKNYYLTLTKKGKVCFTEHTYFVSELCFMDYLIRKYINNKDVIWIRVGKV